MTAHTNRPNSECHGRVLAGLASALAERGWNLGKKPGEAPPEELLERILEQALQRGPRQDGQEVMPLPDRLLEACSPPGTEDAGQKNRELLRSWIADPAGLGGILDSLTLWLDQDRCRDMDHSGLHGYFQGRYIDLRENSYYLYLAKQPHVFRMDSEMLGRRAAFQELPLRHKLSLLGTFGIVNFGAKSIRDEFHSVLLKRYKTGRIAETFLKYHEQAIMDPSFAQVVVVSGFFSLFFSIQDFLAGLRETTVTPEDLQALLAAPLHGVVDFLRENFLRGISMASPSSHFRHDLPRHPALIRSMAMTFWQRKLRERMVWEEENIVAGQRAPRPARAEQDLSLGQDYHSRMILKSIPANATGSLEFPKRRNPEVSGISCRLAGWKDARVILFVSPGDHAAIRAETGDPFIFRFALATRPGTRAYYSLPCILDHAGQVSAEITAYLARPAGAVTKTSRRHLRCAASRLPVLDALLWTCISERPRTRGEFPEPEAALRPGLSPYDPVLLTDLSVGGAGLRISSAAGAARFARFGCDTGLLLLHLDSGMEKAVELALIFRVASLIRDEKGLQAGLQFLAEADCSGPGELNWRRIVDQGCHELGRLLFAAHQQERLNA